MRCLISSGVLPLKGSSREHIWYKMIPRAQTSAARVKGFPDTTSGARYYIVPEENASP